MKKIKLYYLFSLLAALFIAAVLSWWLFPVAMFFKAMLVVVIPLSILAIGFRIITFQRIRMIRTQLYRILESLENFDVDEPHKVVFEPSSFTIFNELNVYLIELIDRIRENYQGHKQFTQNASHELQTPLAIIKGHVELLLQSPNIGEKEISALAIVLQNTTRLSKLNSALILLSKIENHRFSDHQKVNFNEKIEEILHNFKDLIKMRNITVQKNDHAVFEIEMSEILAEMLVTNLIQNAIRHNLTAGFLQIDIHQQKFSIANPGATLDVAPENLFKRFRRESTQEESLGLGLSIVKRICEQSKLTIDYQFDQNIHYLAVSTNKALAQDK
ncbi:MAG: sensor histidine kinase [Saprospiraceae bacterium]